MRFTAFVSALAAFAACSTAVPLAKRESDLNSLSKGVCFLEAGLGVTSLTEFLDETLGGAVTALESQLGVTQLESALGLSGCSTAGLTDLELVGSSLCYLEKGLGVTSVEEVLDSALGGAVTKLEEKLGVTDLEEAIKAVGC